MATPNSKEMPKPKLSGDTQEKLLVPKDIARILGRPEDEVLKDLKSKDDREVLVSKLEGQSEIQAMYGKDVKKLRTNIDDLGETLNQKKGFFGKMKEAGGWVWDKTKAVLGNRWVQLAIAAGLIYLGVKYIDWNKMMSKAHETVGRFYGDAKRVASGSSSVTAPGVVDKLKSVDSSGGLAPSDAVNKASRFY